MNYYQFSRKLKQTLSGMEIRESLQYFGTSIDRTVDDVILVNNEITEFKSLYEAKNNIKYSEQAKNIVKGLYEQVYTDNKLKIADIIKEEHGIKVTNNIIDQYIDLATSKSFTTDPVVFRLREMNQYDSIIENKTHYILEDGSCVAINNQTQKVINNLLENKTDVIEFMNKGSENFLNILAVLIKD